MTGSASDDCGHTARIGEPAQRSDGIPGTYLRQGSARNYLGEGVIPLGGPAMANDEVTRNLESMDELDFTGWNHADWQGVFAHYHTDDVLVDVHGQTQTHGINDHIDAMKAFVDTTGGTPAQITSHPIRFGSGDWTCVVGEFGKRRPDGDRSEVARRRHRRGIHLDVALDSMSAEGRLPSSCTRAGTGLTQAATRRPTGRASRSTRRSRTSPDRGGARASGVARPRRCVVRCCSRSPGSPARPGGTGRRAPSSGGGT